MASLGLVAALGSMLLVSLAASAGPSAWGKFFRDYSAARYCWRSSTPSCPCHLHATVHSDRQGPARHGATQARPRTGRICHSRYLGRGAPSSPYGAAVELIMLMFRTCCPAQIFLFGAEPTKAKLTSEFLAGPPQRGTIQEGVSSSCEFVLKESKRVT